ncbi:di-trans,poly-cis-decaprenylcistransferase [Candidatus Woesearchaeota archaeon]|nr:di-trans,poly-cis-decaprenylcistransferase [Candidatus Woesearchaeota archaeon]
MLERFRKILQSGNKAQNGKKMLRHLAITLHGLELWAVKNNRPFEESYEKSFKLLKDTIGFQAKKNIPILTIYLLPEGLKKEEQFVIFINYLTDFFSQIKNSSIIHSNNIKISALGKWYDIPAKAVDSIKEAVKETKEYDKFFLNFCINYNGQTEIVDACRLLGRQIKADKLDVNAITKDTIKDNIYSSYFLPPDLIIKNGKKRKTYGFLLWDSVDAELYFTNKYFPDCGISDFARAIESYKEED